MSSLKFLVVLCAFVAAVAAVDPCSTVVNNTSPNKFFNAMNACYRDNTPYQIPSRIAYQVMEWLSPTFLLQVVLLVVLVLPGLCHFDDNESSSKSDASALSSRTRLGLINLLFRLGLGLSVASWLSVSIRQLAPCICSDSLIPYVNYRYYGMPATGSLVSTILGLHMLEMVSIPFGIAIPLLFAGAEVCLGFNSVGQVLSGLALGIVLHFYGSRTPFFLRFVDVILNLIAGFTAFFMIIPDQVAANPLADFGAITIDFYVGVVYQIFAIALVFALFDWIFIRSIFRKSSFALEIPDFLYYVPLNEETHAREPHASNESVIKYVMVPILFMVLAALNLAEDYLVKFYTL
eukprot:TRINITY_DN2463_c0_g2_i3.p1 TRINITY_DN2463_c0_g2~~TRINITY_DN2463_c0_g2_i3.p1  ORF type:complete len:348 (+),score=51.41 TRINITY_DN2463_c0_g2_i3:816-1859(+)